MKKLSGLFFMLIFSLALGAQSSVKVIKKDELLQLFQQDSVAVVINFWASWCKPCLQEMPLFVKADSVYKNKKVTFIFVSFDMAEDIKTTENNVAKKHIPGTHYLIDEGDMNQLINAVDSGWSGGLPATWFVSPMYRKPWFQNFEKMDDLYKEIDLLLETTYETE